MSIYSERAKSACEVINDATLLSYVPFDGVSLADRGPNQVQTWTWGDVQVVRGYRNEGAGFSTAASAVLSYGYTVLGYEDHSFSISIWINPDQYGGTILHISDENLGGNHCLSILQLSAVGSPVAMLYSTPLTIDKITANTTTLPINQWTHLVFTFSIENGRK